MLCPSIFLYVRYNIKFDFSLCSANTSNKIIIRDRFVYANNHERRGERKTSLFFSCDPDESFHEQERRKVPKMFEVQGPKLNVLLRNGEPLMDLPEKKLL